MQLATKNDDWIAATMADVMATVVNAAARMPARVSDRVWVRHSQEVVTWRPIPGYKHGHDQRHTRRRMVLRQLARLKADQGDRVCID